MAILMFDLEHFKSINDRFGYAVGDEVLRVFGQVVRASTRADDIIGRFGGEEFIAIVPGGVESASKIAERVRSGFQAAGATVAAHAIDASASVPLFVTSRHGNRRADFAHGGRLLPR
ncbi:MAG: GGDEF domain-containing protein [Pseudolabrys sp.]